MYLYYGYIQKEEKEQEAAPEEHDKDQEEEQEAPKENEEEQAPEAKDKDAEQNEEEEETEESAPPAACKLESVEKFWRGIPFIRPRTSMTLALFAILFLRIKCEPLLSTISNQ